MTKLEYLLICVMEECDEVSQRASKCARFTMDEIQHGQDHTNEERLTYEFSDLWAVMGILHDEGYLKQMVDPEAVARKRAKLHEMMCYSAIKGVINETI